MRCPKCNFPVLPKFDKCPKCGTPLKEEAAASRPAADFNFDAPAPKPAAKDFDFDAPAPVRGVSKVPQPVDGVSIISGKAVWSLGPGQIARRVTEREMADCGAVRGVVVQDGVTAAVFSDGKLVQTLDGGIYRFSNETIVREGKRQTITPQGTVLPALPTPPEPKTEEKKRGFLSRLFGASKETPAAPQAAPAPKPVVKPAVTVQRNTSVVAIYLISNRVFEESFGSVGSVDYVPFEVTASGTPLKVGASMQMRVTDFEIFRRQYLIDSNEVSVETMRRMMTPWVKQILEHAFSTMQVTDGRLTSQQQEHLKQTLGAMLQNRLFGVSIINIFDLVTRDEDFERLSEQQRELAKAERENEFYVRETEFRNRLTDFEMQQEAERLVKENDASLTREKEHARFEAALAELNRDKLLTEDELKQFVTQHEMEMRLAEASRNADEQTRRYESEKILNELADKKLVDDDERKVLQERVANGQFERGQLNDLLRHKSLVSNTLEKLRLDTDLALQQAQASHQLDINALRQETERTNLESILYGKRYAIDRQRAVDELELNSIKLDADLETRRKEDAYAEEKYQLDQKHSHDEWSEKFMRESKEMDRSRENRRADADLDFDIRSRNEEHDFEMGRKRDEHDFDMTSRKAEFDFDLDDRRQDRDIDRTVRLDVHSQNIADRELDRELNAQARRQDLEHQHSDHEFDISSKKAQLDFDLDDRRQDKDVERTVRLDEHGQNIADREHARARADKRDDFDMESQRKAQDFDLDSRKAQLDFDLDDRHQDKDVERTVRLDEHNQNIADREHARARETKRDDFDMESQRKAQDFDFDTRRAQMDLDAADRAHQRRMAEKNLDFDHQETHADKEVERTTKLSAVQQEAADRQHARDMEMRRQQQEELRLKGSIAMENMKAMMEAKRAAKKDELDAETDKLNIKSTMSAEQIAAEQLRDLDASAQAGFMDALKEKSSSAKEAELARREAEMTRQMHEQMMGRADSMHEQNRNDMKEMMAQMMKMQQMSQQQAMDLARHSMDTSATIASTQAASNASAAERRAADLERDNQRYREDARHAQERVDSNQAQSLNYTTRVTETDMKTSLPAQTAQTAAEAQAAREEVSTVPLNTAWLRSHGFAGSFNELAGQLSSLGASISKDFDADGNPIIVVDGIPEGQVFDTLQAFGVEF